MFKTSAISDNDKNIKYTQNENANDVGCHKVRKSADKAIVQYSAEFKCDKSS